MNKNTMQFSSSFNNIFEILKIITLTLVALVLVPVVILTSLLRRQDEDDELPASSDTTRASDQCDCDELPSAAVLQTSPPGLPLTSSLTSRAPNSPAISLTTILATSSVTYPATFSATTLQADTNLTLRRRRRRIPTSSSCVCPGFQL